MGITSITNDSAVSEATGAARATGVGGVTIVTFESLRQDPEVQAYIKRADEQLGVLGFTEHGQRHTALVASISRNVVSRLA